MDRESLVAVLDLGLSLEEIGRRFDRHPSTVSYWLNKYGLQAFNRDKHAAKGGIPRDRLAALVEAGMSIAEIAAEVGRGKATVRHWLRRYGLRTRGGERAQAAADGRRAGLLTIARSCPRHGETHFALEGRGYYRCKLCRQEQVARHRREVKALLVAEAGGCCQLCGYDRCVSALEFHHLDPVDKRLGISAGGLSLSVQAIRAEAAKCVLLCSNCHAEVESGMSVVPLK
jgi:transposase